MLEVLGLCLPGSLFVFSLLAHQWLAAAATAAVLVGLAWREWLDWSRTAITLQSGQIRVYSPYGFRRTVPAGEVDRMLRAGTNVYFLSRTGERLGAFPAGVFSVSQIESLAAHLDAGVT